MTGTWNAKQVGRMDVLDVGRKELSAFCGSPIQAMANAPEAIPKVAPIHAKLKG